MALPLPDFEGTLAAAAGEDPALPAEEAMHAPPGAPAVLRGLAHFAAEVSPA